VRPANSKDCTSADKFMGVGYPGHAVGQGNTWPICPMILAFDYALATPYGPVAMARVVRIDGRVR
jgi:hypothetical protein